jgi:hypothetical protein
MTARARAIAATAALALLAGCGGGDGPARPERGTKAEPEARVLRAGDFDTLRRAQAAAEAAWRAGELRKLEGHTSVQAALRRALLRQSIGQGTHDAYLRAYDGAKLAARKLTGARRYEELAVVGELERLAATGQLIAGRMPAVFLNLRRNTRTWTTAPFPRASERRTFDGRPEVFQYVPGHGMQLHVLATWGVVNARLRTCLGAPRRCPRRALTRRLDELARLAAPRGAFVAWEYYYPYAQGTPPWMSGMAQATAIQALSRGSRVLRKPRFGRLARRALGAFETPPPAGVAVPADGGTRYVMYSFAPTLRILNGELQAVNGLRDVAVLGRSPRATRLVRAGDIAARAALGGFDTGAWSLYSAAGAESTLSYHQLTTRFLEQLCQSTGRAAYCEAGRRFARYEREPPRIAIAPLHRLWAQRAAPLRFTLSKGSQVQVRVFGPHGTVLARDLPLSRGGHDFTWTPPSRGRFRLHVQARGPEGRLGISNRTVRVAFPKPKPKHKAEPKPEPKRPKPAQGTVGGDESGLAGTVG